MKKVILLLAFISSVFSSLTNAETLINANGVELSSCTTVAAPVTYVSAGTNTGTLQLLIGGKSCWVTGLSDIRLGLASAMLSEAISSGRNAYVGVVLGNINVQLY